MANLESEIKDVVAGRSLDVARAIKNIPTGQTLTDGWFTVKDAKDKDSTDDSSALVKKHVTTVAAPEGRIEDDGAGDRAGMIVFFLVPADTEDLIPSTDYYFDITVKTSGGKYYTPERGKFTVEGPVTKEPV